MESWRDNCNNWIIFMAIVKINSIEKDKFGVKLKFPNRKCVNCKRYPCFPEIEKCSSDFAAYGCTYYK